MAKLRSSLTKAVKPVKRTEEEQQRESRKLARYKPLPEPNIIEVKDTEEKPAPSDYVTIELKGTTGKTYKVVMPHSYARLCPKQWKWTGERYAVAGKIAAGIPMTEISDTTGVNRTVIYAWLQHPEFKEHVDGLTLETGWANKRERIAGLNRVTRLLFDKVVNEIDSVHLTDKNVIGPILQAIQMIAKQLGQEKEEFVEQSKVEQNTNISGAIGVAEVNLDRILDDKTAEERKALEEEFNKLGDDVIRAITGEKE